MEFFGSCWPGGKMLPLREGFGSLVASKEMWLTLYEGVLSKGGRQSAAEECP